MLSGALFSSREVAALGSVGTAPGAPPMALNPAALFIVIVLTACYAGIAGGLTVWSIQRLGRTWGRA